MAQGQIKNDAITRQEDDFAQWYTDVCRKAELMDYSSVKGFIIYRPYGYAIWEEIQNYLKNKKNTMELRAGEAEHPDPLRKIVSLL